MKRLLLACLLCAACKTSSSASASAHTETSTVTDTTASESGTQTTVTTTTQAPGKTVTTVEEFAPPEVGNAGSEPGITPALPTDPAASGHRAAGSKVPHRGPLVKRTVTVTETGGETTQTRQEAAQTAQAATETHAAAVADTKAQAEHKSAPAGFFAVLAGLWPWLLAGAVVMAGIVAWRIFGPRLKR